jgi:hypothetical protein
VFVIFKNEQCVHASLGLGTFLPHDVVTRTVLSMEKLVTTEVDGDTMVAQIDESRIVEKLYLLPDSRLSDTDQLVVFLEFFWPNWEA